MARRLSWVAGVAGATFLAHLLATILTLSFGAGLSLSNFDGGGETWATRLGHLLNWFHDNVLSQPLHPLERNYPPWSLGRGWGGLALNSAVWATAAALLVTTRIWRARQFQRDKGTLAQ